MEVKGQAEGRLSLQRAVPTCPRAWRRPVCTLAAAWALPGCPLRWFKALEVSCLFPEDCSCSTGYWVPAHPPRVWGPAWPTPGGPHLGAHSGWCTNVS